MLVSSTVRLSGRCKIGCFDSKVTRGAGGYNLANIFKFWPWKGYGTIIVRLPSQSGLTTGFCSYLLPRPLNMARPGLEIFYSLNVPLPHTTQLFFAKLGIWNTHLQIRGFRPENMFKMMDILLTWIDLKHLKMTPSVLSFMHVSDIWVLSTEWLSFCVF